MQGAADGFISGMVSGAFAGAMNPSFCFVANAALNTASYCAGQLSSGGDITLGGLGVSAITGGLAGFLGGNGWQYGQNLGMTAASLSGNGFKYALSVAGGNNLGELIVPALVFGTSGGFYGSISKRYNPAGDFVGF